jgi:hypothetical protein
MILTRCCQDQRQQPEGADKRSRNALAEAGKLFAQFERGHIEHYQVGIQFEDRFLDRLAERERITRRPRKDDHRRPVNLILGQIQEWRWFFIQAVHFAVPRYTNHCEPFVCQVGVDLLAERFLVWPVAIHKCFADDHRAILFCGKRSGWRRATFVRGSNEIACGRFERD